MIDKGKAVVNNGPWSSFVLRDNAHRRDAQIGESAYTVVREDHPRGAVDHVGEFVTEELDVVMGRLVGSPVDGRVNLCGGPWGGGQHNWGTMGGQVLEEVTGWVR
mmetsp:Transcript_3969/g.11057  ORF Transcript_3969/g.11057 Transcript_3969/m.11057 type:complete len:105 (-) Transcript_3969:2426-2740(-)